MAKQKKVEPTAPEQMKVMIVTSNYYGLGDTINEAKKKTRSFGWNGKGGYKVFVVHPETFVTDMGYLNYPMPFTPKQIAVVGLGKKKKAKV